MGDGGDEGEKTAPGSPSPLPSLLLLIVEVGCGLGICPRQLAEPQPTSEDVDSLRQAIERLAVQGKPIPQDLEDELLLFFSKGLKTKRPV